MVSTSTCCCGEPIKGHVGDAHHSTAIPYGCKCYTASWER